MRGPINLKQMGSIYVGVSLGCAQARVPQLLLNGPQIRTCTQQMCGAAVAQGVGVGAYHTII